VIRPVDLGVCDGHEYEGDPARTAIVLPGGMFGGMPGSLAAPFAAEHGLAAVWTTPLLDHSQCADGLRARTAPVLLVGGTADESWPGELARELADEVLELAGADHGLTRASDLEQVERAVAAFSARVLRA
jgi:pimeloyl-ACP methyl ester carboxylesterase